jgi:hypothetical protein
LRHAGSAAATAAIINTDLRAAPVISPSPLRDQRRLVVVASLGVTDFVAHRRPSLEQRAAAIERFEMFHLFGAGST